MDSPIPVYVPVLLFLVVFPTVWTLVLFLLSQISGWSRLAAEYATDNSDNVAWKGFRSGMIGIVSHRSSLWIGTEPDGLYLKTGPLFFFRPFHPPVRIPWSAIESMSVGHFLIVPVVSVQLNNGQKFKIFGRGLIEDSERYLEREKIYGR